MAEADIPICTMRKNAKEELRFTFGEFKGHRLFQARVYYQAQDGSMQPGKAGLAISVDKLPDFADAVSLALEKAREAGLVR